MCGNIWKMNNTWHVLPRNDIKKHDESKFCDCCPKVSKEGKGWVVVHRSYDRRELNEPNAVTNDLTN